MSGNLTSNPHAKWLRKLEQHLRSEKAHAYANTVEQAADEIDRLQCEVEQFGLTLRRIRGARDQNVSSGEAGAVGKSETPTGGVGNQMPGPGSSPGTALSPEFRAADEPLSTDDMDESGRDGFFQNVGYTGTANGFIVRDGTYWIATFRTGAEADAYAEWRNADEPTQQSSNPNFDEEATEVIHDVIVDHFGKHDDALSRLLVKALREENLLVGGTADEPPGDPPCDHDSMTPCPPQCAEAKEQWRRKAAAHIAQKQRAAVPPSGPPLQGLLSISMRPYLPHVELIYRFESLEQAQLARNAFLPIVTAGASVTKGESR